MNTTLLALNLQLTDGAAPEWAVLIPAGPTANGHDGRRWINDNPQRIVDAYIAGGRDLPIDLNHANEIKAPAGDPSPAHGWIKDLQIRHGAVWARIDWNAEGKAAIEAKHYRYLSPAIYYDNAGRIQGIKSAGLVNSPNLMGTPALNAQTQPPKEHNMNEILAALGLNAEATEADAVAAIGNLKTQHQIALNAAQHPPLDKFVPRADYDKQVQVATNAQQQLTDLKAAGQKAEVEGIVNDAIKAGKITPVQRDYYIANCMQEGGLQQFKQFIDSSPPLFQNTGLDNKQPGESKDKPALNAEQTQVATMMGVSKEDIDQYGK